MSALGTGNWEIGPHAGSKTFIYELKRTGFAPARATVHFAQDCQWWYLDAAEAPLEPDDVIVLSKIVEFHRQAKSP